jgi:hypothetical protein
MPGADGGAGAAEVGLDSADLEDHAEHKLS